MNSAFFHQFRQRDLNKHPLDTCFVAWKAMTQMKLNICLISFYMGWACHISGNEVLQVTLRLHNISYEITLSCCILCCLLGTPAAHSRENLLSKNVKYRVGKYYHLHALSLCVRNKYQEEGFETIIFLSFCPPTIKYLFRDDKLKCK